MSTITPRALRDTADQRWASMTTAVRSMLRSAGNRIEDLEAEAEKLANRVADLEAQLRTERDLNADPETRH